MRLIDFLKRPKSSIAARSSEHRAMTANNPSETAESLAARLPAIALQADRVAGLLATGRHGLRRSGPGETFWQYRPAVPGESITRIDWRQSARGDRAWVRETEAENAQTIYLWVDLSPSMEWCSEPALPEKRDRALLMIMAAAILLHKSGEKIRILTPEGHRPLPAGNGIAERLALAFSGLLETPAYTALTLPPVSALPPCGRVIAASDFLCPDSALRLFLHQLTGTGISATLLHISDPAEEFLPWDGRVRFAGTENEASITLPDVTSLRPAYESLIAERNDHLERMAFDHGHFLVHHRTDHDPAYDMLQLQAFLSARVAVR